MQADRVIPLVVLVFGAATFATSLGAQNSERKNQSWDEPELAKSAGATVREFVRKQAPALIGEAPGAVRPGANVGGPQSEVRISRCVSNAIAGGCTSASASNAAPRMGGGGGDIDPSATPTGVQRRTTSSAIGSTPFAKPAVPSGCQDVAATLDGEPVAFALVAAFDVGQLTALDAVVPTGDDAAKHCLSLALWSKVGTVAK
jgi:hypothetical protein